MSAKNDENPCQVSGASPRGSRLLKYLDDVGDRLGELTADLDLQLELNNSDEGYPGSPKGSPPARRSLNLRSRGRPHEKLQDATNVLVLSNLPDVPYPKTQFAEDTLYNCGVGEKAEIRLGKRPDMLFIYNLSAASQRRLASFMKQHFPQVLVTLTMGVPPYSYREDTTEMLLNILRSNQREQMSYHEIYKDAPRGYLILTNDFPYDTNRLVEVNQGGFHGIRLRDMLQRQSLDSRHLMCLISVRCLAPLVHRMISTESRLLDRRFLESLSERILTSTSQILDSAIIALAVEGEALKKPLEHLVTCVPGVEVVWTENRKVIRKLELPERAGAEPPLKVQAVANSNQEALHKEQEIVKILSDILKRPSNLYMSLDELESALRQRGRRVERSLRQFITERPKHFQILGESDYEVVTLSHRAQIKRVCNDLQKVLRPRKPKCISSADIAAAFARHWHATNEMEQTDRRFNVEDFGVCYLDDLLVTIPQHWGVHCSEYVSTDGVVVRRVSGDGEEDVPEFVPRYPADRVYAWIPRSNQTETQKKSLALLKQQVLNMFRGDPSAEALIEYLTRQNRSHGPDHNRLIRLAYLRANRPSCHQGPSHNGRDNPTLPCNLEFEEKTFVPLYHRFCGEQVALNRFGVKDLFELFDSMMDTFIATGHGQDRKISLTSDARREILERRIIDILRMSKRSMTMSELLQTYKRQPTMSPYFNEFEIKRALVMSKLIERAPRIFGGDLYRVRPIFECSLAVAVQPDIGHVLTIFMLSYAPLDVETIGNRFSDRTGRSLDESVLRHLENAGAIRLVTEFTQLYDLHDVCRVVRNLVYKMNELPSKIYTVESPPYTGMNLLSNREVSVASLLSFSGDFTFIEPETLNRIMCDFTICFEEVGDYQFKLRQELMAWVPAPEETDNAQNRRTTRTSNQTFRGAPRSRQNLRFQRHQPPNSHYQRTGHRQGGNNAH